MSLLTQKPPVELEKVVCRYTSLKVPSVELGLQFPHGSYRIPDSRIRLAFHYSDKVPWIETGQRIVFQPEENIRGYQLQPMTFNTDESLEVFTIEFTPFGFYHLFGISCKELKEFPIHTDTILSRDYQMLTGRLRSNKSFPDQIRILNEYLTAKMRYDPAIEKSGKIQEWIDQSPTVPDVQTLAENTFTTKRSLQRFFDRYFGLPPKAWLQLKRMEKSCHLLLQRQDDRLFDMAIEMGFYDQAHFTNEFKRYMGMTPVQFCETYGAKQRERII